MQYNNTINTKTYRKALRKNNSQNVAYISHLRANIKILLKKA